VIKSIKMTSLYCWWDVIWILFICYSFKIIDEKIAALCIIELAKFQLKLPIKAGIFITWIEKDSVLTWTNICIKKCISTYFYVIINSKENSQLIRLIVSNDLWKTGTKKWLRWTLKIADIFSLRNRKPCRCGLSARSSVYKIGTLWKLHPRWLSRSPVWCWTESYP